MCYVCAACVLRVCYERATSVLYVVWPGQHFLRVCLLPVEIVRGGPRPPNSVEAYCLYAHTRGPGPLAPSNPRPPSSSARTSPVPRNQQGWLLFKLKEPTRTCLNQTVTSGSYHFTNSMRGSTRKRSRVAPLGAGSVWGWGGPLAVCCGEASCVHTFLNWSGA